MVRRRPIFARELNPYNQLRRELNLHIKVLSEFITNFKRWLKKHPDEEINNYVKELLEKVQSKTGVRFFGTARENVALRFYIDTILEFSDLSKEFWVNKTRRFHNIVIRQGYLEAFRNLLNDILESVEQKSIKPLINKIKDIFFIAGDSTKEVITNLFKKAENWRDELVSLINIPTTAPDDSQLPLLTDEAIQVLLSVTKQFNSAHKKVPIPGDYLVPTVFSEDLLGEWEGLKYQKRYEYILQILGFRTIGTNWCPTTYELPSLDVNLIEILENLELCEIKPSPKNKVITFTLDSYSLHLIYYFLILKNINNISDIAVSWISYYFARVIYSYYRLRLENEGNPFAHLMEEANFKVRFFAPLWQVVAILLPLPNNIAINVEKEWLQSAPKETDDHIKKVIEYVSKS